MRFSRHCFGFQSQRFLLLVGYNIQPSSSSTNQNAALIIDHTSWILLNRYINLIITLKLDLLACTSI